MLRLKILIIKLKFIVLNSIWILLKFNDLKVYMNDISISNIQIFKFSSWTTNVRFFLAEKNLESIFVKMYNTESKGIREAEMFRYLSESELCLHLPKFISFNQNENKSFLILEQIDGVTLTDKLENLNFSLFESLLDQIILILELSQKKEIVHCDIRPDNIMLNSSNQIILIDFEYAVCKRFIRLNNLNFEKKLILKNLGGEYLFGNYIWDDAYSFHKIILEIIDFNNYSEIELQHSSGKINKIKSFIGINTYEI